MEMEPRNKDYYFCVFYGKYSQIMRLFFSVNLQISVSFLQDQGNNFFGNGPQQQTDFASDFTAGIY